MLDSKDKQPFRDPLLCADVFLIWEYSLESYWAKPQYAQNQEAFNLLKAYFSSQRCAFDKIIGELCCPPTTLV